MLALKMAFLGPSKIFWGGGGWVNIGFDILQLPNVRDCSEQGESRKGRWRWVQRLKVLEQDLVIKQIKVFTKLKQTNRRTSRSQEGN